jgi:hypothetical protein
MRVDGNGPLAKSGILFDLKRAGDLRSIASTLGAIAPNVAEFYVTRLGSHHCCLFLA